MQKITTFLTFNDQAEKAVNYYTSIFKNSKIVSLTRYGEAGPGPKGSVMVVVFQLFGQEYMALNAGPHFTFSQGISLLVNCETQQEVDELWEKLSEGGEKLQCGWLIDRFGVTWQIAPTVLGKLMQDKDAEKAKRVTEALMKMDKIEIKALEQAYEQ